MWRHRHRPALPWINTALVLQDQPETLTLFTSADQVQTGVKVSFFGGLTIGRVADPDDTLDRVALLASPHDLLATKLKVLLQRAERKDYQGWCHPVGFRPGGGAGAVWLTVSGP